MSIVLRPESLRHVCKEPLANVRSVQLRGREITRLVGLSACPNLTSLDISYNALTELEPACFEGCKELWIVDASHNRLASVEGLSSLMALGYLNLSSNPLPLEALRPLAYAHILELFLGSVRVGETRRRTLGLLPNVWVLDDEYVTARERRVAEEDYSHGTEEKAWNNSSMLRSPEKRRDDGGAPGRHINSRNQARTNHERAQPNTEPSGGSGYGSMETQGRHARDFYENVMWKLPSRRDAADTFRLTTLLERYDERTAAANTSAWLGSFTCGAAGGGVRRCVRREWSIPSPRSHLEALMSLPLELKLDVAVLLAVRATLRNCIPQQVLEEALMVLLVLQGGLSGSIHNDLSRVPAFVCTALVHALRSSILRRLDQNSTPGHSDTTAPPLLDQQHTDLLEALPPVVTGVGVDNVLEGWERSSLLRKSPTGRGEGGHDSVGGVGSSNNGQEEGPAAGDQLGGARDVLPRADLTSAHHAEAPEAVVEARLPVVTVDPDGSLSKENPSACSSVEAENTTAGRALAATWMTSRVGMEEIRSDGGSWMPAATELPTTEAEAGAAMAETATGATAEAGTTPSYLEAYAPASGVGLTRLCRRAVVLLTRSPACPDLVAWQTHPAEQRTYDQMEPLLARAHMTHKDLHPTLSVGHDVGDDARKEGPARISFTSSRQRSPSTPSLEFSLSPTAGKVGERKGNANDHQQPDGLQSPGDGFWSAKIRRPKAGERVQVLQDTWSVIVTLHAETFSVFVAPFEGMQLPPYRGDSCVDSRDLCYDPRGWWRHAPALLTNPPTGPGRLHRLARGISAAGLPWGAGSLNEPLVGHFDQRPCLGGGHEAEGSQLDQEAADREDRAPALAPRPATTTTSAACRASATASSSNPPITPAVPRRDLRSGNNNVVDVFSAKGSWDPVFVMAPPRLVGLQNQTAARKRGRRRARQLAWRRIDRPEASLAPRPMMPRCASLPAPTEASDTRSRFLKRSASTLGHPNDLSCLRLATVVAPSHGGNSGGYVWSALSKSSLAPSVNAPGSLLMTTVDRKTALSGDDAWLELQREMGSLKADNRMFLRGSRDGGGQGNSNRAHPLRASESPASVLSKSLAEISTVCDEATTDLLAKPLSFGLDTPKPAWNRGIAAADDKPTTVFELTHVGAEPERNNESSTVATNASSLNGGKPAAEKPQTETHKKGIVCSTGDTEGRGERGTRASSENVKRSRSRARAPWEGDSAAAATTSRTWKPNAHRPPEWFPVPGRQVLLVDPSDARASAEAAADGTIARGTADRSAVEPRSSSGVDLRPRDTRASGDRGSDSNGDTKGRGGKDGTEYHRERRRGPRGKGAGRREEGERQVGDTMPRILPRGNEHAVKENSDRPAIVLSARSTLPAAASVVDLSCPTKPTDDPKAGARATARAQLLSESRRTRPHTSAGRAYERIKADAHSGRATAARKVSTAVSLIVSHSQPEARVELLGGRRRTPEASRSETACASMSTLGEGVFVGPLAAPEHTRPTPFSPNARQREWAGGGSGGGRVEVGKSSSHRQRRPDPVEIASLTTRKKGWSQSKRLPVRTTATAVSRVSHTPRKEPAVVGSGSPRERRHRSRGVSNSQPQRVGISGWEGEDLSVAKPQDCGTPGSVMDRARGPGGAHQMLPTTPLSGNMSVGDTFSIGSANSSISGYCGWNKTSNSQT